MELSQRAKVHVNKVLSMERAKKQMSDRLENIWQELGENLRQFAEREK
jgi:hypothetical protein